MKKKTMLWMIAGIMAVILLFLGFQQWGVLSTSAETITKKEAEQLVANRYKGEVTAIKKENDQYRMEMNRNNILYEIKLDARTGKVIAFTKLAAIDTPAKDEQEEAVKEKETEQPDVNELKPNVVTEETIKKSILDKYPGELILYKKIYDRGSPFYKAIMKEKNQKTILHVDANSGEVLFHKVEEDEGTKQEQKQVQSKGTVKITEKQAGEIALKHISGEIDDIDLEDEGDLYYYIVEIETADGRDADVQIHAITGEILSISWDD